MRTRGFSFKNEEGPLAKEVFLSKGRFPFWLLFLLVVDLAFEK